MWWNFEQVNFKHRWWYVLDDMEGFSIANVLFQKDLIGIELLFGLWIFNISHRGTFLGVFTTWMISWEKKKKPKQITRFWSMIMKSVKTYICWMALVPKVQMSGILNNSKLFLQRCKRKFKRVALSVSGNCKKRHWTNTLHVSYQKKLKEWIFCVSQSSSPYNF